MVVPDVDVIDGAATARLALAAGEKKGADEIAIVRTHRVPAASVINLREKRFIIRCLNWSNCILALVIFTNINTHPR